MISTYHKGDETVTKNVRGRDDTVKKPVVIENYNKYMSGVDLHDQFNKYYEHSRKSVKWWKKVFFWLLEASVTNAYILKKLSTEPSFRQKITLLKFREELVAELVSQADADRIIKRGRPSLGPPLQRLNGHFHCLEHDDRINLLYTNLSPDEQGE